MKTKALLFIAAVAAVTLSFTFSTSKKASTQNVTVEAKASAQNEPVGGFVSEDKL